MLTEERWFPKWGRCTLFIYAAQILIANMEWVAPPIKTRVIRIWICSPRYHFFIFSYFKHFILIFIKFTWLSHIFQILWSANNNSSACPCHHRIQPRLPVLLLYFSSHSPPFSADRHLGACSVFEAPLSLSRRDEPSPSRSDPAFLLSETGNREKLKVQKSCRRARQICLAHPAAWSVWQAFAWVEQPAGKIFLSSCRYYCRALMSVREIALLFSFVADSRMEYASNGADHLPMSACFFQCQNLGE
jgi:hypothetical protein